MALSSAGRAFLSDETCAADFKIVPFLGVAGSWLALAASLGSALPGPTGSNRGIVYSSGTKRPGYIIVKTYIIHKI